MYQIYLLTGYQNQHTTPIYDQSQMNSTSSIAPKCNLEINEAGSLSFTLMPDHPLYNTLEPLSSFIKAVDDGEEIFFGRVLSRSHPTVTGQVTFQCEGGFCFLLDSEIEPYGKDEDGNTITKTMTAEEFFRECIRQHNAEVNDSRREFVIGTINARKRNKSDEYSITQYTQTKNAIETQILDVYGGFIRIRPVGDGRHYIDWVEHYSGTVSSQRIQIGNNVKELTNEIDGSSLFTVLRPVGKDGLTLSGSKTINLYSSSDINRYGRIVRSIEFSTADTEEKLRSQAETYADQYQQTLFVTSNISLVDMHYLDGSVPKLKLGNRLSGIVGIENQEMIVSSMALDFENPQNDTLDLKNRKSLDPDMTPEGNRHKSKSLTKSAHKSKKQESQFFKTIKETDEHLEILAKTVYMHGETLTQHYEHITTVARDIQTISSRVDDEDGIIEETTRTVGDVKYRVQTIEGTSTIQDAYFISQVAGMFEVWTNPETGTKQVHLVDGAEIAVDDHTGATITVGSRLSQVTKQVGDTTAVVDTIEGSSLWTQRDSITGVCGEFDVEYYEVPDPDHPGKTMTIKKLVVKSGGGMSIRRDGVEYGLYDNGNLTGGLIVEKINNQTVTKIKGDRVDLEAKDIRIQAETTLDTVVGHWEEDWVWDVDEQGNKVKRYYLKYVADAGMVISRLGDDGYRAEFGVWDEGNLTGGILVEKINGETVTKIKGSKVYVGDAADSMTLPDWCSDRDGLIAGKATIGDLAAVRARVGDLEADYVSTQELYSTIGGVKYLTGQAISVTGSVIGKNLYADGGDVYIRRFEGGHPTTNIQLGQAVSAANVTLSGDTYTLHLYNMYGEELTPAAGKTMTFSRATDLTGEWTGGDLVITANPQGDQVTIHCPASEPNNLLSTFMITTTPSTLGSKAYAMTEPNHNTVDVATVGLVNGVAQAVTVARKVHGQYDAGWTAAYNKVNVDGYFPSTSPNTIPQSIYTAKVNNAVDGNRINYQYYVTADASKAYIRYGSTSGAVVAQVTHNQYSNGWTAAYDKVNVDGYFPSTSPNTIPQSIYTAKVNSAVDGNRVNYQYYVTADETKAYIRYGSTSGAVVAQVTHNQYSSGRSSGWTAARASVIKDWSFPTVQLYSDGTPKWYIDTYRPSSTLDGSADLYRYYVTADDDYAYIRYNGVNGTVVAKTSNPAYGHGQSAGYASGYDTCAGTIDTDTNPSGTLAYGTTYTINVRYTNRSNGSKTTKKTITFTTPADRYNDGYDTCAGTIDTDTNPSGTLAYGTTYTINVRYTNRSNGSKTTKKTITFTTPSDRYNTGWTAAYNTVNNQDLFWTTTTYTDSGDYKWWLDTAKPSSTPGGSRTLYRYYVTCDNSYAYIRYNSTSGNVVARTTNNAYANGYTQCANTISTDTSPSGTLAYGTTYTINVQYTDRSSGSKVTKKQISFTTPSDRYDNGWTNCRASVVKDWSFPTVQLYTDNGTPRWWVDTARPNATVGGSYDLYRYFPDCDDSYVYIKYNGYDGAVVARGTNNAYTHGWNAAINQYFGQYVYSAHCSSGTPSGGGLYTYTFTVTSTSGTFTAGKNYAMGNKEQ